MRTLHDDQRGVSSVVLVVSLIALFGAAVISVDAGNIWQTRRNIATATDATSLQEAALSSVMTSSPSACTSAWTAQLSNNAGSTAQPIACSVVVTHTSDAGVPMNGYVVVEAKKRAASQFGGVVGVGASNPYALSAAQWGPPNALVGLRPFGLCDEDGHYMEWLAYAARGYPTDPADPYNMLRGTTDHPLYASGGVTHRIYVDNSGSVCGQAPGNWAWLDYDSTSNPTGAQRTWWETGYTPLVGVHSGPNCTDPQASDGDPIDGCVPGNTGNRGTSFDNELRALEQSGEAIPIMVFSHLAGTGQNSIFQTVGFLSVIVRNFDVHGSLHSLDLEFVRHAWGGTCCSTGGSDNGTRVTRMCDVDHDAYRTVAVACS